MGFLLHYLHVKQRFFFFNLLLWMFFYIVSHQLMGCYASCRPNMVA